MSPPASQARLDEKPAAAAEAGIVPAPDSDKPAHSPGRLWRWRPHSVTTPRSRSQHVARPKRNLTATLREWHKRAGLFAFVFMGWLGMSGFLINQSADWGYDTIRVDWSWVMALYGLRPEPPRAGLHADGHWLAATSEATLLDGRPLTTPIREPLGMAAGGTASAPLLFVAASDRVVVLKPDGTRVDELTGSFLPVKSIRRIGTLAGAPRTVAVQDLDVYVSTDGLAWSAAPAGASFTWAEAAPLPESERSKALPYSRPSVSLEHVLVDAHSGRLFGQAGAYVINAVGLAALWLGISGAWMMWRTSRRRRAG